MSREHLSLMSFLNPAFLRQTEKNCCFCTAELHIINILFLFFSHVPLKLCIYYQFLLLKPTFKSPGISSGSKGHAYVQDVENHMFLGWHNMTCGSLLDNSANTLHPLAVLTGKCSNWCWVSLPVLSFTLMLPTLTVKQKILSQQHGLNAHRQQSTSLTFTG